LRAALGRKKPNCQAPPPSATPAGCWHQGLTPPARAVQRIDRLTMDLLRSPLADRLNTVGDIPRYDSQTDMTAVVNHLA